jgi:hypothetical protein
VVGAGIGQLIADGVRGGSHVRRPARGSSTPNCQRTRFLAEDLR